MRFSRGCTIGSVVLTSHAGAIRCQHAHTMGSSGGPTVFRRTGRTVDQRLENWRVASRVGVTPFAFLALGVRLSILLARCVMGEAMHLSYADRRDQFPRANARTRKASARFRPGADSAVVQSGPLVNPVVVSMLTAALGGFPIDEYGATNRRPRQGFVRCRGGSARSSSAIAMAKAPIKMVGVSTIGARLNADVLAPFTSSFSPGQVSAQDIRGGDQAHAAT
jgi:hypothetical protein